MSNKIIFDLQVSPLDAAALLAEKQLVKRREKSYYLLLIALGIAIAFPILGILILSATGVWLTLGIAVIFLASTLMFVIRVSDNTEAEIAAARASLEPLTPDSDPQAHLRIADLAEQDGVIRRYFQEVAAQGRLPVRGEIEAAKAWVADAGHRQLQAKARAVWQSRIAKGGQG